MEHIGRESIQSSRGQVAIQVEKPGRLGEARRIDVLSSGKRTERSAKLGNIAMDIASVIIDRKLLKSVGQFTEITLQLKEKIREVKTGLIHVKTALDRRANQIFGQILGKLGLKTDKNVKEASEKASQLLTRQGHAVPPKMAKEIQKTIAIAAKHLKQNQSVDAVEISSSKLGQHTFLVQRREEGKLQILVKAQHLGSGAAGDVYKGIDVDSHKPVALKYAKDVDQSIMDLKSESDNLALLHADGKTHEGIQSMISLSQVVVMKDGKLQASQTVSKGKLYPNGDLEKQARVGKTARLLGISVTDLPKKTDAEIKSAIFRKVDESANALIKLTQELKILQDRAKEQTPQERMNTFKEIALKKAEVAQEFLALTRFVDQKLLDENVAIRIDNDLQQGICENIPDTLHQHFDGVLMQTVKKSQKQDIVDVRQRMALGGNVVNGLRHMHEKGMFHGDLKPPNFFWGPKGAVIADFGGARVKNKEYRDIPQFTAGYAAISYIDALIYFKKTQDKENVFKAGMALDQRAMGVSLYEMIAGGTIPEGNDVTEDTYEQMRLDLKESLKNTGLSPNDQDLVAGLISKMSKPIKFENNQFPADAKIPPLDDADLAKLASLLKSVQR